KLRVSRWIVYVGCHRAQNAARPKLLSVFGPLLAGIIEFFWLLFGVEMVEIAEPVIGTMHRRQKLVSISQVIFAELGGRVTLRLEQLSKCGVTLLNAARRARNANGRHSCSDRQLAHDECCATGGAAGLTIVVGKQNSFLGNSINVGGSSHHAVSVGTDIPHADVVAEDDENVRALPRGRSCPLLRLHRLNSRR